MCQHEPAHPRQGTPARCRHTHDMCGYEYAYLFFGCEGRFPSHDAPLHHRSAASKGGGIHASLCPAQNRQAWSDYRVNGLHWHGGHERCPCITGHVYRAAQRARMCTQSICMRRRLMVCMRKGVRAARGRESDKGRERQSTEEGGFVCVCVCVRVSVWRAHGCSSI